MWLGHYTGTGAFPGASDNVLKNKNHAGFIFDRAFQGTIFYFILILDLRLLLIDPELHPPLFIKNSEIFQIFY